MPRISCASSAPIACAPRRDVVGVLSGRVGRRRYTATRWLVSVVVLVLAIVLPLVPTSFSHLDPMGVGLEPAGLVVVDLGEPLAVFHDGAAVASVHEVNACTPDSEEDHKRAVGVALDRSADVPPRRWYTRERGCTAF